MQGNVLYLSILDVLFHDKLRIEACPKTLIELCIYTTSAMFLRIPQ
uniref:Uncharacterized protein n=1 Tax=Rhizophora mucronata TaxID=61149 RepID=A0A2P2N296_RHIMU